MLDSNGIPFTFVGRQNTSPFGKFTKTHHEGYCGAVVAPPGVYGAHQYSTANNYLEKVANDALSVSNADIVLVLIGANDIGRGRNPYQVATNDIPTLLTRIFSNRPNAYVILDKPTTLSNGFIAPNFNYGAYATNVPIYAAALQAVVTRQRAAGHNVSLADMFSAVNYSTGFNGDHVHPNTAGLNAVAQEWFTRIRMILTGTNQITTPLIYGGDAWTFWDTGTDPGTNWNQLGFDDSGWSGGYGRFGWGEATDETPLQPAVATYFRKTFVVPWNYAFTNLNFRLSHTGGAVVYLNGQELFRTNMPAGPVNYTTAATNRLTGYTPYIYYPTNLPGAGLVVGTNIIAVEEHETSAANTTGGFDMELIGEAHVLPRPTISATLAGTNIALTWPANSGATFTLYSTPSLDNPNWQAVGGALLQTNGGQIMVSIPVGGGTAYYRLQRGP